jgi:hypothetical protein
LNTDLLVAVLAGCFGIAGTLIASIFASRQTATAGKQEATAREVARIDQAQKDAADEARHEREEERDARREYNYQAQKRLYELYEPLRFQLVHATARALRRISEISLVPPPAALPDEHTRTASAHLYQTAYDLLAPLALVSLVERQMTLIDLRVDGQAALEFWLAKGLTDAIGDDVLLARLNPQLSYNPYVENWKVLREKDPRQYQRQGLDPGELETVLALLITTTTTGVERVRSSGEFMAHLRKLAHSDDASGSDALNMVFDGFTVNERPVLWRVLVCQTLLYGCFLTVALLGAPTRELVARLGDDHASLLRQAVARRQRLDFDWKVPLEGCNDLDPDAVIAEIPAAVEYYRRRVAPAAQLIFDASTGWSWPQTQASAQLDSAPP